MRHFTLKCVGSQLPATKTFNLAHLFYELCCWLHVLNEALFKKNVDIITRPHCSIKQ